MTVREFESAPSSDGMTVRRERTLQHIAYTAMQLIQQHGLAGVTMTMIASSAEISRKTLYEYVPTKRALVEIILEYVSAHLANTIGSIVAQADGSVTDAFRDVFKVIAQGLRQSHRVLADIAVSFPTEWAQFERTRAERAERNFRVLAEAGVRSGALRPDISVAVLVDVYLAFVRGVLADPRTSNNSEVLFSQGVTLLMEGMTPRKM